MRKIFKVSLTELTCINPNIRIRKFYTNIIQTNGEHFAQVSLRLKRLLKQEAILLLCYKT